MKKNFDRVPPREMRWLKQREEENGKLKKLVVDLSIDKEMRQGLSCRNYDARPNREVVNKIW
ncbi:hypothetical protein [Bradyrhizobium sp. CCBAU 11386]|uniref:hypothetical protein n=1 Tax=Bradyrhizobium sp. CCBAU 11386 TaxID=1630837 RepID=UPI0023049FD0|nr:hypothetical protein [Bradyrhizobium sp. CCBAU 11386]